MTCLHCGAGIPESFFEEWSRTRAARRGIFQCPRCQASHLRQLVAHAPDGRPIYEVRLWGHPVTTRRYQRQDSGVRIQESRSEVLSAQAGSQAGSPSARQAGRPEPSV